MHWVKRLTYLEYGPVLPHSLDSRHSTHVPPTVELAVVAIHHLSVRKGHSFSLPGRARVIICACANEYRIATRMHFGSIDEFGYYENQKPNKIAVFGLTIL